MAPTSDPPSSPLLRLRGALAVLAGTPRILAMVWSSHPQITLIVLALNVFQGFSPLVYAWLNKLVLDAVATAVTRPGDPMTAAPTVATLLLIRAGYQMLNSASGAPVRYYWQLLSDHVTRRVQDLVLAKATSFRGISFFESPRFFDLLQRVQNQSRNYPIAIVNNLAAISHRFSTVRMADRIVLLEDGRIKEQGTHAELIALQGTYADLYEKQASRYR